MVDLGRYTWEMMSHVTFSERGNVVVSLFNGSTLNLRNVRHVIRFHGDGLWEEGHMPGFGASI